MAYRAVIIAIETYPAMAEAGLAGTLDDTIKNALDFNDWLIRKWQREGRASTDVDVVFCSEPVVEQVPAYRERSLDPPRFVKGQRATRQVIVDALLDLKTRGDTTTDELYFYFSGHGFSFSATPLMRTDYVLTSDFRAADRSADCCLNLTELVAWLRMHLVNGRHFYFVDACRNDLSARQIRPGPLPLPVDSANSGDATVYAFQSARAGATTVAQSVFAPALIKGLDGAGRSKQYLSNADDQMVVTFPSLRDHLQTTLGAQRPSARGDELEDHHQAVFATLKPPPLSTCTVKVAGWQTGDAGVVRVRRGRGAVEERPLNAGSVALELPADDYAIGVRLQGTDVAPSGLVTFDGYDGQPAALTFSKGGPAAGGGLGATPPDTDTEESVPRAAPALPIGPAWATSRPHTSIAERLPHDDSGVDFSESLGGKVRDLDLDVWLAILGGGRVLSRKTGDFSKIGPLKLYDFAQEPPGAAPLYVLSGFQEDVRVEVSVSRGVTPGSTTPGAPVEPAWHLLTACQELPGLSHLHRPTTPGPKLVSIRLPGHPTWTLASHTTANRATLVTLTLDEDGDPQVSQYLLPLGHLVQNLPAELRSYVDGRGSPLDDVRNIATAGRAFRRRGDIGRDLPPHVIDELFYAKWVDPIGSAFAAYQALRRGDKGKLGEVASNMMRFFPDLPDSAAVSRLAGKDVPRPPGVPLFLEGLRAYPDYANWLPLPAGLLNFDGPWTAWRGAV